MDELIKQLLEGGGNEILWHETTTPGPVLPPVIPSAFLPYLKTPRTLESAGCDNGVRSGNVNKRLIEFSRSIGRVSATTAIGNENHGRFDNIMKERMRREKERKSYSALYSMLPIGTKNNKISITQTSTKRIQELEGVKEDLERRNNQLQADNEGSMIRLRIDNPTHGIDYMLDVLKCLKTLESKPRIIQSDFTNQELLVVLDHPTKFWKQDQNKDT